MIKAKDILLGLTLLAGTPSKAEAAPAELRAASEETWKKTELCLNLGRARGVKETASDVTQLLIQVTEAGLTANLHTPERPNGHAVVLVNDIHLDSSFDGKTYETLKKAGVRNFALEGWNGEDSFNLSGQSDFVEDVLQDSTIRCLGIEKDSLRVDAFLSNLLILELDKIFAERYLEATIKEHNPDTRQNLVTIVVKEQKRQLSKTQIELAESVFLIKARGKVNASAIEDRLEATVWLNFQLNEAAQNAGFLSIDAMREAVKDRTVWEQLHEKVLAWRDEKTVTDRNIEATARIGAAYRKNPKMGAMALWLGEGHRVDLLPRLLAKGFTVLEVERMKGDDREAFELQQIEDTLKVIDQIIEEALKQEQ